MEQFPRATVLAGVFQQLCPRCRSAKIFCSSIYLGFPRMRHDCPVCNLKFEREEGYFLGAMYISYGLALVTIGILALIFWLLTTWSIVKDVIWAVVLFLPLAVPITLFARVLWIYLDQAIDPERV